MKDQVYAISRCEGKRYIEGKKFLFFHFKGAYKGKLIKKISLWDQLNSNTQKGEDYLLSFIDLRVEDEILWGVLTKIKNIREIDLLE